MRYFKILCTLGSFLAILQPTLALSTCGAFVASPPRGFASIIFTRTSDQSFIVSSAIACPASGPACNLKANGFVTQNSTLNISTNAASEIYNLIASTIDLNITESLTGRINNVTVEVQNGTAAYETFTPYLICTEGILSNCPSNADIVDGTAVLACTPRLLGTAKDADGFGLLDGALSTVQTNDREMVRGLSCNPANSTVAREGRFPGTNCTAIAEEERNMSGVGRPGVSMILFGAALMAVFVVV